MISIHFILYQTSFSRQSWSSLSDKNLNGLNFRDRQLTLIEILYTTKIKMSTELKEK